jgi:HPt (histidine-containing phosphotransfer) domain-containing protein
LLEELDGDREILARMLEIFERDCDARLIRLRAAVRSDDWGTVEEEAHALKSGVGNFFADQAYETASQLEIIAKDGDETEIAANLHKLEAELKALRTALNDTCHT